MQLVGNHTNHTGDCNATAKYLWIWKDFQECVLSDLQVRSQSVPCSRFALAFSPLCIFRTHSSLLLCSGSTWQPISCALRLRCVSRSVCSIGTCTPRLCCTSPPAHQYIDQCRASSSPPPPSSLPFLFFFCCGRKIEIHWAQHMSKRVVQCGRY